MEDKYIGIYTIVDDSNFGNRLQNFALQKCIADMGFKVLTIQDSQNTSGRYYKWWNNIKLWPGLLQLRALKFSLLQSGKNFKQEVKKQKRIRVFRKFTKKYVPMFPDGPMNIEEIKKIIIGSDQIWNPFFRINLNNDFLVDVNNIEKISYAASIGISDIDEKFEKIFRHGINQIDYVSVREETAKEYLEIISDKNIEVVLDPTMLIKKSDWSDLTNLSRITIRENYIATYFLGTPSNEEVEYIKEYARKGNYRIINLNDVNSNLYTKIGPIEFISIIKSSHAVFSDSYHAAVFSVIFNKNFELFTRRDNGIVREMNTRMETLFNIFNLDNRLHPDGILTSLDEVNYEEINSILINWRKRSLNWLTASLEDEKNETN